jgi:hypothetical protein
MEIVRRTPKPLLLRHRRVARHGNARERRRDGGSSLPSSATAALKFATNASALTPTLRLMSCGSRLAATRTKVDGSLRATRRIASRPSSSQMRWKSERNDSDSLLREPRGRPLGLPLSPTCHGGFRPGLTRPFFDSDSGRSGAISPVGFSGGTRSLIPSPVSKSSATTISYATRAVISSTRRGLRRAL